MLILMPAEMIADPGLIGQAQTGTVASPQPVSSPAQGGKITIVEPVGAFKKISKEGRSDFLTSLNKSTLANRI
jgi:hypothetical protein